MIETKDLMEIKETLEEQGSILAQRIAKEEERLQKPNVSNPDRSDLAYSYDKRQRDSALLEQTKEELEQVENALDRIESGSYGKCKNCGNPIPPDRLKILPYTSLCVTCKTDLEK